MKTILHTYYFDTSKPTELAEYTALATKLHAKGYNFFHVLAIPKGEHNPSAGEIELETKHLFSNQWNSNVGRVFDWYEGIYPNRNYKKGHWLEITNEMRAIRDNTTVCGYCGKNYPPITPKTFCDACLDSQYLKESNLYMLRLMPVAIHMPIRALLTEAERADLVPRYTEQQTESKTSRAVLRRLKQREKVNAEYNTEIEHAKRKHKGFIWLLDHFIDIDTCIYYRHRGLFSFGWRHPVSAAVKSRLLDLLTEFDFPYEIKTEDGDISTTATK